MLLYGCSLQCLERKMDGFVLHYRLNEASGQPTRRWSSEGRTALPLENPDPIASNMSSLHSLNIYCPYNKENLRPYQAEYYTIKRSLVTKETAINRVRCCPNEMSGYRDTKGQIPPDHLLGDLEMLLPRNPRSTRNRWFLYFPRHRVTDKYQ